MLNCCIIEPARKNDTGSIGAFFVAESARKAGHTVDVISADSNVTGYDVELVSIHHPADYPRLKKLKKHGHIRIIGGHITYNNPRPVIKFADYICMGDGETWIIKALALLDAGKTLQDLEGTIVSESWVDGSELPDCVFEKTIENPPYLNRAGTRSAAWYIEIARGCPFSCHYCELGHSMPYRFRKKDTVIEQIGALDLSKAKKIVFFAPDEASHPSYFDFIEVAKARGVGQRYGSYRLDMVLKLGGLPIQSNQLVRVGIDGLTEETRRRVNKPLSNDDIVGFYRLMLSQGHVRFKMFQMIGHPWEKLSDFDEFENLINKITQLPTKKNISLRIKWTPLIPQPITPLSGAVPKYDLFMAEKVKVFHEKYALPQYRPGFFIDFDGLMSKSSHSRQVEMTQGDESSLLS